jgi:hypothetical protein
MRSAPPETARWTPAWCALQTAGSAIAPHGTLWMPSGPLSARLIVSVRLLCQSAHPASRGYLVLRFALARRGRARIVVGRCSAHIVGACPAGQERFLEEGAASAHHCERNDRAEAHAVGPFELAGQIGRRLACHLDASSAMGSALFWLVSDGGCSARVYQVGGRATVGALAHHLVILKESLRSGLTVLATKVVGSRWMS